MTRSETDPYRPRYQIFLIGLSNLLLAPFKLILAIIVGIFGIGLIPALERFGLEFFYKAILPIAISFQRFPK